MASFKFDGVDALGLTFEKKANLSDDDLLRIIRPGAELLRERLSKKVRSIFAQRTGALADSFKLTERVLTDGASITVLPGGKHSHPVMGKRKPRRKSDANHERTNIEIAFILEHGSPRIKATHFMETTAEESEDAVYAAMEKELDAVLAEKGL